MSNHQAALKPHEAFIGKYNTLKSIVNDLNKLEQLSRNKERDDEKVQELRWRYPFLESAMQAPALGNTYWELRAYWQVYTYWEERASWQVWSKPSAISGHLLDTNEARPFIDAFEEFEGKLSANQYKFFPEQRPVGKVEDLYLLYYRAYDELWASVQNMNPEQLTPLQKQEKRELGRWVAEVIQEQIIEYELVPFYNRKVISSDEKNADRDNYAYVKNIVQGRIAKGDWQIPGVSYKFKFNGV